MHTPPKNFTLATWLGFASYWLGTHIHTPPKTSHSPLGLDLPVTGKSFLQMLEMADEADTTRELYMQLA